MERIGFPMADIVFGFVLLRRRAGVECWRYMCAKRHTKTPQSLVLICVKGWRVVHVSSWVCSGVACRMCFMWVGKVVYGMIVSMYVHVEVASGCGFVCMANVQ